MTLGYCRKVLLFLNDVDIYVGIRMYKRKDVHHSCTRAELYSDIQVKALSKQLYRVSPSIFLWAGITLWHHLLQ